MLIIKSSGKPPKQGRLFRRFVLPLLGVLQLLNFASHFLFFMVEVLTVRVWLWLLVLATWVR
jgi:hypothetical protein